MTVNVNVIGLLMNLQVLIHSMLNWNLELLGKQKYPEKKNLSEQVPENQQQTQPMPHIMVSMFYIKSFNTLNHNTTFASKVNFIDKQRTVIELVP